jgi:hypothetical protein
MQRRRLPWPYRMVRRARDLSPRRGQYRKDTLNRAVQHRANEWLTGAIRCNAQCSRIIAPGIVGSGSRPV